MSHRWTIRLLVATALIVTFSGDHTLGQGAGGRGGRVTVTPGQPRDTGAATAVGTASIAGAVVVEGGGTPVRRARVTLTGVELRGGRSTVTDDQGRFSFTGLPAGRFSVGASKPGFVGASFGARRAGRPGTAIQLTDGQRFDRAVISIPRGGVITGIVVDEHGEPTPGTPVRVLRYVMQTGERTLQQAGQDQTDDRGMYRVFQLQPGEYVVNAVPRNLGSGDLRQALAGEMAAVVQQLEVASQRGGPGGGPVDLAALAAGRGGPLASRLAELEQRMAEAGQQRTTAYAPVYYPGTTSPSAASAVTLGIGEERSGVDFQLQLVPTSRVGGMVVSPDGALPQGTQVALVPADRGGLPNIPGLSNTVTRVGADGRFAFNDVTPGQYSLQARATIRQPVTAAAAGGPGGPGGPGGGRGGGQGPIAQVLWASADLAVGGQSLPDVVLTLQPGMTVTGRVDFQGAAQMGEPMTARVALTTRGPQSFEMGVAPAVQSDAGGRFTITGVAPGRYTLSASVLAAGQGPAAGRGRGGRGAQPTNSTWALKSAVADGMDVLDFPVEIAPNQSLSNVLVTFTDRTQELSGTIQDAAGRPTSDFTIIVFATDNRYWLPQSRRIASARPGTDGRFLVRGLPAGDYRLTAVTDVEPGEWYDPAFLSQVGPSSIPIRLVEGDRKVQDIRLAGG